MNQSSQRTLAKQVRSVLSQNYTAARWTAGGYMLRNKQGVHRDGFRISTIKNEDGIRVFIETQELLPLRLWIKAPEFKTSKDFNRVWQAHLEAAQAYQATLKSTFDTEIVSPLDYSLYPYLLVKGLLP